jgi:hypothetical protein
LRIAHIINPFAGTIEHEKIQNITFESISNALKYSIDLSVELISVQFSEDVDVVPDFFDKKVVLDKSVQDYNPNLFGKKLPLLKDILACGIGVSDADYIIFSNIDIGLQPNFYKTIHEFINQGIDSFIINKRRVSKEYDSTEDLNQIYSEVGGLHTGYDCFVFKRELFEKYNLGNVCVGVPYVDSVLLFNMACHSLNLKLFTHKHLTFHLGFELIGKWGGEKYLMHNKNEYIKVMKEIKKDLILKNIPGSGLPFFQRHFKWLMNPTIPYPTIAVLDFKQWNYPRYKQTRIRLKGYYEWLQHKVKLD